MGPLGSESGSWLLPSEAGGYACPKGPGAKGLARAHPLACPMSPMPVLQAQWDNVQPGSLVCACVRHSSGCPPGGRPAEALRIPEQRSGASQGQLPLSTGDPVLNFHFEETAWSLESLSSPPTEHPPSLLGPFWPCPGRLTPIFSSGLRGAQALGVPGTSPESPHWSPLIRGAVIPGCWAHLQQLSLFKKDSAGKDPAWNEAWGGDTGLPRCPVPDSVQRPQEAQAERDTGLCLSLTCSWAWVPSPQWVISRCPCWSFMWLWKAFSDRGTASVAQITRGVDYPETKLQREVSKCKVRMIGVSFGPRAGGFSFPGLSLPICWTHSHY